MSGTNTAERPKTRRTATRRQPAAPRAKAEPKPKHTRETPLSLEHSIVQGLLRTEGKHYEFLMLDGIQGDVCIFTVCKTKTGERPYKLSAKLVEGMWHPFACTCDGVQKVQHCRHQILFRCQHHTMPKTAAEGLTDSPPAPVAPKFEGLPHPADDPGLVPPDETTVDYDWTSDWK